MTSRFRTSLLIRTVGSVDEVRGEGKKGRGPSSTKRIPICIIPDEILLHILLLAAGAFEPLSLSPFRPTRLPISLRHVSRAWMSILDGCCLYWATVIGSAADDDAWSDILERTGVAPLVVSTTNWVALPLQAAVVPRARELYVTRDGSNTRWNSVLTSAGNLPVLRTLHLSRDGLRNEAYLPLTIDAPNLLSLSVDCSGNIIAPLLTSFKVTNLQPDLAEFLSATLSRSPNLSEFEISSTSFDSPTVWDAVLRTLANTRLKCIRVYLLELSGTRSSRPIVLPSLERIYSTVSLPISSAAAKCLEFSSSLQKLIVTLRGMPNLRTLILGRPMYGSATGPPVILAYCETIVFQEPINSVTLRILDTLRTPLLANMALVLDMDDIIDHIWLSSDDIANAAYTPRRPASIHSRSVGTILEVLHELSPRLEDMLTSPVALYIHFSNPIDSSGVSVTYRAEDAFVRARFGSGLSISTTQYLLDNSYVEAFHLASVLCAFTWPKTTSIQFTSSARCSDVGYGHSAAPSKPFAVIEPQDQARLMKNLSLMSGVSSVFIQVEPDFQTHGLEIIRALTRRSDDLILPELTRITFQASFDKRCVSLSEARWWDDVENMLLYLRMYASGVRKLPLLVVFEGNFHVGGNIEKTEGCLFVGGCCTCT